MTDEPIDTREPMRFEARDVWLLKRVLQALLVANVITVSFWAFSALVAQHPNLIP